MNYEALAGLLLPNAVKNPAEIEARYPERTLPDGAKVTRLGPSPTGFIHLGNLYGAFVDERLAHQSGGIFYLRIEDTDDKREVEGAAESIISSLQYFGIDFDEGALLDGEKGGYGPYHQSARKEIYQVFARVLIEKGLAYPCFCTEEELSAIREEQEKNKENPGYYGKWAKDRDLTLEEIEERLNKGLPYVLRFRADVNPEDTFTIEDGIRGPLTMPVNFQDVVLLKQNGIPTYHFAHVVDDHLMRTTHVVRGEEWLSSLPIHVALFQAMEWDMPRYCHTTVLMKMEGENKRKLSKRKDPELALDYYKSLGYHPAGVREYLLTILNSNYEEWRIANPDTPAEQFDFTVEKMSSSGTLFDLDKLNDVCKEVLVKMPSDKLLDFLLEWAETYRPELAELFTRNKEKMLAILSMDRTGPKPRKDLIYCEQIFEFISYFFDDYYKPEDTWPDNVDASDVKPILTGYLNGYSQLDDASAWFDKIRTLAEHLGYAAKPKDFKKNPDQYKGHVGDVSTVIRVALMGRKNSPDLWTIQQIMGEAQVRSRIEGSMEK